MEQKIIDYIKNEFHSSTPNLDIEPDDDLLSAGLVDSMGMMRLIQYIEEQFSIKVAPQDMTIENFITVDAMAKYISASKTS